MKNINLKVLLIVFCIGVASAFYNLSVTNAQTVKSSSAQPRPTVSPTPFPTASPVIAPSASPAPVEDDPNEIIRIETEEVNLNVRVVDRNNRSINNVRQEEFKVYEDNVLQPITAFTRGEVPTNYSLVIDNSGSLRQQLDDVIAASKIIINTNRPADETSVVRFVSSDKIEIVQDFTNSKADLDEALENMFIEGGQTAIIDAVYLAAEKVDQYEKTRNPNDKKRRALILVTDGEDRDSFYKEIQLYQLLRESDVQIYVIGFVSELSKEGGFITKSPQGKAKAFLERLATETGGKVYFPTSIGELGGIAQNIATELRTQYLVSYAPTDEKKDGTFRNIKVVVSEGANKEKRIAITRTGRNTVSDKTAAPVLQKANPQIKSQ